MARGGTAEEILKCGVLQELVRSASGAVSNRIRLNPWTHFHGAEFDEGYWRLFAQFRGGGTLAPYVRRLSRRQM
jgi:hypothetical protein